MKILYNQRSFRDDVQSQNDIEMTIRYASGLKVVISTMGPNIELP